LLDQLNDFGTGIAMLLRWYRAWIGRFVFRKLNLGIGLALLLAFGLIGFLTYNSYFKMLEDRERTLLEVRTQNLYDEFHDMITQFKREATLLYPSNREIPGFYQYFYPSWTAGEMEEEQLLAERNIFSGYLSNMLERNPRAHSVYMYQLSDRKLYARSRYPTELIDEAYLTDEFFPSLPRDYLFPYVGRIDNPFHRADQPVLYIVNPVFDFHDIHYENVLGYVMIVVDSRSFADLFQSAQKTGSRLLIRQGGNILLDSREGDPHWPADEVLSSTLHSSQYHLTFTGITDMSNLQRQLSDLTVLLFGSLVAIWLACLLLIQYILRFVIRRLKYMTQHFKKVQTNPFVEPMHVSGEDEIADLMERFNRMTSQLQEHINRVYIANMQKSKAEYVALKMQINPHFLYNTLESLRMQAVINRQPVLAEKLFYLGKLYRWVLKTDREEVPMEEELQYTRYYLDLYMMGKSKRIELETDTEADLSDLLMPKFSLQPIVENAILHGELEKNEDPVIRVRVEVTDDIQKIEIWNNGTGISEETRIKMNDMLQQKDVFLQEHLGLKNIHERIRAYYGEKYGLTIPRQYPDQGFRIWMTLPRTRTHVEPTYAEGG
jgi:sensor histidine kinase YesM